jgi:hypothetical protein
LLSETKSESFAIPFYSNPLTPHVGCSKMIVTMAVVTKNVCMSSR